MGMGHVPTDGGSDLDSNGSDMDDESDADLEFVSFVMHKTMHYALNSMFSELETDYCFYRLTSVSLLH